jgi:pimeloyl-ACP methyl ester carboxylesterase
MMTLLNIDGKKVNVVDLNPGGGSPLILIHGLFTNLSLYYLTVAFYLAKDRRVVLYDMRSHGLSERRDEGYTLDIMTNDLLALMAALKIDRATLCGYSYGGDIALYTALWHPERVERLVLIETPALTEESFIKPLTHDSAMDLIIDSYSHSMGINMSPGKMRKVKEMGQSLLEGGRLLSALRQGRSELETLPLEELRIPVLLLYGGQSPLLQTGRAFAERIPSAQYYETNGDHNLPVRRPAWVLKRINAFLAGKTGISLRRLFIRPFAVFLERPVCEQVFSSRIQRAS